MGRSVTLDVLFEKETLLPGGSGEKLTRTRLYNPAHNVGHFRYLECSRVDEHGHPTGDITLWDEIYFPFDPALQNDQRLDDVSVARTSPSEQLIEEIYTCDRKGIIEVDILNHATQYRRSYRLHGHRANATSAKRSSA